MDCDQWKAIWLAEEKKTFSGWDFSCIANRTSEEWLPWDYKEIVLSFMDAETTMLDMGTGGGEFLLSLHPPQGRTFATEAYPENFELCKRILLRHGIEVHQVFDDEHLPYEDDYFDLIINRHESFSSREVFRILKPGGIFVTQQVGGQNNRELSRFLLGNDAMRTEPDFNLQTAQDDLASAGFTICDGKEHFPYLRFFDIGALVYFAKIIEWEFPGFSVEKCFDQLCELQKTIEETGYMETIEHRFMIVGRK
ncbi:class I SAM-dependent methyltransferase [Paenibacillus sp. DMB20]|uniref:class I SAM-dependent methyltransferase n=1 Tax=Paenibacillus sp. DMB20 TaxID=1642570 RepID=UPI00062813CA|nr:class I SAM-dependent methyltransferase [Paenibacillus sp. DMB20]KKO52710.1 methyltransferase [Paenibacillus sp. DMB20]